MIWVTLNMSSSLNRQGNVREFHIVWRVVSLYKWHQYEQRWQCLSDYCVYSPDMHCSVKLSSITSVWAKITMSEWLLCVFSRHALQCEAVIHSETIGDINNVSYMSLPAFDLLSWIIFEFESTVCVKYWDTLFSVVILLPCERIGVNFYKAARLEPPTFQTPRLSGFWAPQFFVTCNAYYEAVFCGLPNNKMTPNDNHANQTTIMSLSTHDRSGLSHDIVQPGTIDNSVLSLIISVLSFKGIHNGICNLRFSLCVQAYCKGRCRWQVECRWGRQKSRFWGYIWLDCLC